MSWITIVWSMNAAACLTLAGIYLLIWCKQREGWVYLVFSCSAVAAATLAGFELAVMRAETTAQYAVLLRWMALPVSVLIVSLVVFVRLYLHAGRAWLVWSICGLRIIVPILNFVFMPHIAYRAITGLRHLSWWGETVAVPVGITSPWILISHLSLLLTLIFFVDATITAWRWGDRQRALIVGGSMIFFATIVFGHVILVLWGIIHVPFFACFPYLGILAAMAYELGKDTLRAAQLTHNLQMSEAALRDTGRHMELAANAGGIGMWTWDIARNEIWMTKKGRSLLGFSESEKLNAERVRSVVHPEDLELVRQAVERSLNTGEESEAECRIVLPDGQIRWITRRGRVEFDRDGKPTRMNGVWFDITERRLSEAALRDTERRMELAAKAAGIVVWTWDIPRDDVWLSERDRALFGFSKGEKLNAERIRSVVHPEDREFLRELVKDSLKTHGELEVEYRVMLSDGRVRWVTRRARVEFDGKDKPVCERGVLIDITEQKQTEVEMARQRGELAHLSRVTMLGELSGSLAHELNQPLTAILSNAQAAQRFLAEDDVDLAEVREILNDIVAEDKRAGEVIQRLRLLLKKGEAQQHSSDININDVVQDVLKLMRNDFINQNVAVNTELAPNLPTVTGDRIQLQQVLLNLVLNGCEAMTDCDRSECELRVVTHLAKDAVRVSVRDGGGSIPEEKMEHVFDPFFTTKDEGMGLGLSICRTIIKAHRGKIWATNNPDRGATFHFELPVTR